MKKYCRLLRLYQTNSLLRELVMMRLELVKNFLKYTVVVLLFVGFVSLLGKILGIEVFFPLLGFLIFMMITMRFWEFTILYLILLRKDSDFTAWITPSLHQHFKQAHETRGKSSVEYDCKYLVDTLEGIESELNS